MSWLSNLGKAVGKGVKDVGHTAGKVLSNPLVDAGISMIPGVGPLAGAAAGGIGNLMKPGGNLGKAAGGAVKGGLLGKLAGLAGNIPGVSGLESRLGSIPGASAVGGALKGVGQELGGAARTANTDLGGVPGNILGQLGKSFKNPDGSLDIQKLLGAGGALAGVIGQEQSNKNASKYMNQRMGVANQMLQDTEKDYASRAPMRDAASATLSRLATNGPSGDVYRPFLQHEQAAQQPQPVTTPQPAPMQTAGAAASGTPPAGLLSKLAMLRAQQPKRPAVDEMPGTQPGSDSASA